MDRSWKNILVVRFSAMGDVAMLLPVLSSAAIQFPSAHFTFLTSEKFVPLCRLLPSNVTIKGVSLTENDTTKMQNLNNALNDINYASFDVLLDLNDIWRSRYIRCLFFLKAKKCFVIKKGYLIRWLITHFHSRQYAIPVQQRYLDVFNKLGLDINISSLRSFDLSEGRKSGIGIAPFAKHPNKIYPIEKMERVVKALSERMKDIGENIYLFGGGEKEISVLQEWVQRYANTQLVAGKKTLYDELRLMQSLRLMLSMDSANMHLASLVGTRVISIWGATNPVCGFYDFNQAIDDSITLNLPCQPCSVYGKKLCKYGDKRCMNIDEQRIVNKIMEVYA